MFETPEKVQYDSLMAKLTAFQRGEDESPPDEKWLNSAKKLAQTISNRGLAFLAICLFTILGVMAFAEHIPYNLYVLVPSGIVWVTCLIKFGVTSEELFKPLAIGLCKLSRSSNCKKALALIEKFEACRTYQEKVLAQGREFVEFDYQLLKAIAQRQPGYTPEMDVTVACRELHGIKGAST